MNLRLIHRHGEAVQVTYKDRLLFTYEYDHHTYHTTEFWRPYFHPVNTLAGDTVTLLRPHDHPYHRGVSGVLSVINEQNFWGGPTYDVGGERSVQSDNIGQVKHIQWDEMAHTVHPSEYGDEDTSAPPETITMKQRLHWQTTQGHTLLRENRRLALEAIHENTGYWSLRIACELINVSGGALTIVAPHRDGAHRPSYAGLFWRGARSLERGRVFTSAGDMGRDVMGAPAEWCAHTGMHDSNLHVSTVVIQHNPDNPRYPTPWFSYNDEYAGLGTGLCYHEPFILPANEMLSLEYRLMVANGEWTHTPIASVLNHMRFD